MFFRDVTLGPHETQLHFRLVHFWEAWNPLKKTLIGLEMLLIDEQGIISPGRIEKYLSKMKRGSVYKLNNFYGSSNKSVYRVSDHAVTVSFSWNSELTVLHDCPTPFDEDIFRFHSFEDFQANCDRKGDLYAMCVSVLCGHKILDYLFWTLLTYTLDVFGHGKDVVGHMKLVNGQRLIGTPVLDEVEIARARHLLVHVQSHEYSCPDFYVFLTCFYGLRCPTYHRLLRLANGNEGVTQDVPVPEALISTIGQTHKFCVKVTKHNLEGKTRSLTVSKILSLDTPPATEASETFETGTNVCEASKSRVDSAEGSKRSCDSAGIGNAKRPKCGN
ncbi:hypothetical protein Bca4012_065751 [Brassica carinata]